MLRSTLYCIAAAVAVTIVTVAAAVSCGEPRYPAQLVEADSAMMRGDYPAADSLLAAYAPTDSQQPRAVRMYYQLLRIGMQDKRAEPLDSFGLIRNLCDYYETNGPKQKYARALLYAGIACRDVDDMPSALNYYLHAKSIAEESKDMRLLSWICCKEGDLYLHHEMYEDCPALYRQYYTLAKQNGDTLQMALAAFRMGRAYTILDKADSAVASYKESVSLARCLPDSDKIVPYAKRNLIDLFIQLEDYAKAAELMDASGLNDDNRAYYYYGINQLDSAAYYFEKVANTPYNIYAERVYWKQLADIEVTRGNVVAALRGYRHFTSLCDSVGKLDKDSKLKKIKAQYNYKQIEVERDAISKEKRRIEILLVGLLVLLVVASLAFWFYRKYRERCEDIRIAHAQMEFLESDLYMRIRMYAGKEDFRLNDDEWDELTSHINKVYNGFVRRLLELVDLSETELRVCCLVKIGIQPAAIATMLFKTKAAISLIRCRMYQKLTGEKGTPKQFDEFLMNF